MTPLSRALFIPSLYTRVSGGTLSGGDILLHTQFELSHLRRFPVTFHNDQESFPGHASLSLGNDYDTYLTVNYEGNEAIEGPEIEFFTASSGTGSISVLTSFSMNGANESHLPTAQISASIESDFLRISQSFIMTPTSNVTGQIIISPSNPVEHSFGNQIFYASSRHPSRWVVPILVRVLPFNATDELFAEPADLDSFVDCSIEADRGYLWIPEPAYHAVLSAIHARNIRSSYDPATYLVQSLVLHNITESILDYLPSIQYLVLDDNGQQVSIQVLPPRAYLIPNIVDPSSRSFRLRTGSPACDLPGFLTNRMLIHVDGVQRRIGFGEPQIEL